MAYVVRYRPLRTYHDRNLFRALFVLDISLLASISHILNNIDLNISQGTMARPDSRFPLFDLPDSVLSNILQRRSSEDRTGPSLPLSLATARVCGTLDPYRDPLIRLYRKVGVVKRVMTGVQDVDLTVYDPGQDPDINAALKAIKGLKGFRCHCFSKPSFNSRVPLASKLTSLKLVHSPALVSVDVSHLRDLVHLDLSGCFNLKALNLGSRPLHQLRVIICQQSREQIGSIPPSVVLHLDRLPRLTPNLETLCLSNLAEPTALAPLTALSRLTCLEVLGSKLTRVPALPQLQRLHLGLLWPRPEPLDPDLLTGLAACTALQEVELKTDELHINALGELVDVLAALPCSPSVDLGCPFLRTHSATATAISRAAPYILQLDTWSLTEGFPLAQLTALTRLNESGMGSATKTYLTALSALAGSLKQLSVNTVYAAVTEVVFSSLSLLTNLQQLDFPSRYPQERTPPLAELPTSLTWLELQSYNGAASSLTTLSRLSNLRHLHITCSFRREDIETAPLALPHLTYLDIAHLCVADYAQLPALRELRLFPANAAQLTTAVSQLRQGRIRKLHLRLNNVEGERILDCLTQLTSLQVLTTKEYRARPTDVKILAKLPHLENVYHYDM